MPVVRSVQLVIGLPSAYQLYESVPVPPDTEAVRVNAWSEEILEVCWLIFGIPREGYTVIGTPVEVAVSGGFALLDVPASTTFTFIVWIVMVVVVGGMYVHVSVVAVVEVNVHPVIGVLPS